MAPFLRFFHHNSPCQKIHVLKCSIHLSLCRPVIVELSWYIFSSELKMSSPNLGNMQSWQFRHLYTRCSNLNKANKANSHLANKAKMMVYFLISDKLLIQEWPKSKLGPKMFSGGTNQCLKDKHRLPVSSIHWLSIPGYRRNKHTTDLFSYVYFNFSLTIKENTSSHPYHMSCLVPSEITSSSTGLQEMKLIITKKQKVNFLMSTLTQAADRLNVYTPGHPSSIALSIIALTMVFNSSKQNREMYKWQIGDGKWKINVEVLSFSSVEYLIVTTGVENNCISLSNYYAMNNWEEFTKSKLIPVACQWLKVKNPNI